MAENRSCNPLCQSSAGGRELVCIDTYRVLDSCRDKDCFENVRVYLTHFGQEIIERASAIRAKAAKIASANIDIDPLPFNRGFYQITIKLFVKLTFEACVSPGNIQEIDGIAAVEKKLVLYGSEGNVSIFKSTACDGGFCSEYTSSCSAGNNLPTAVLEVVDPVLLDVKIVESCRPCLSCCCVGEIPDGLLTQLGGGICDDDRSYKLIVSLGFFSVVRIERPAQYLINASEYAVPDKICPQLESDDPCKIFKSMEFPSAEFYPPSYTSRGERDSGASRYCGCDKSDVRDQTQKSSAVTAKRG